MPTTTAPAATIAAAVAASLIPSPPPLSNPISPPSSLPPPETVRAKRDAAERAREGGEVGGRGVPSS